MCLGRLFSSFPQVPVYQNLFKSMEYANMETSMEKVLKGNFAFISWKTYFRNLIARDYTERNGETQVKLTTHFKTCYS